MNNQTHIRLSNMRNWFRRIFWQGRVLHLPELSEADEKRLSQAAKQVLNNLRVFCRADQSCVVFDKNGQVDTHATAVLEGRREVWLKITQLLNVTDEQLIQIANRKDEYVTRDDA